MTALSRNLLLQFLALLSMICLSSAQSTCEDCCNIYNALLGPFASGISWYCIVVAGCFYIVMKKLPGGGHLDAKIVGVVNLALVITVIVWYIVMRVDVDCECCQDDRTGVIILLSIECVGLAQSIFFNFFLNYKYQYWRYWCGCAKTTETTNQKEMELAAV